MKTMAFAIVGTIIITVHSEQSPSAGEWAEYVKALKDLAPSVKDQAQMRNVVFTSGGAPNSAQRKAVNDIAYARSVTSAIISGSQLVRTVVTAFSWFNEKVKAFSPEEIEEAFKHLRMSPYEIELVHKRLAQLRSSLDVRSVRATG